MKYNLGKCTQTTFWNEKDSGRNGEKCGYVMTSVFMDRNSCQQKRFEEEKSANRGMSGIQGEFLVRPGTSGVVPVDKRESYRLFSRKRNILGRRSSLPVSGNMSLD